MNAPRRPRLDRSGHSMVELLTVLVLIAVIVSLAQPSMNGYVARNKTRRALDQVTGDVAYARMLAVRSGRRTVLRFDSVANYKIWVERTPADTVKRVTLKRDYAGVGVVSPTTDGRLVFDSRGLLLSTGTGRIIATARGAADTVNITIAGRVYRAQ